MPTLKVTDATFQSAVLEAELPVLVDFWATWCAPCRAVAPILEELAETYAGKLLVAKVDVDESPRTAQAYRIRSIPTLAVFEGGRALEQVAGALPRAQLVALLERHVSTLKPPTIEPAALAARLTAREPTAILDLRDPRDFGRSHLRRARCVPAEALEAELAVLSPDTLVVLVDRAGEGATAAAARFAGRRPQVVALAKGLLAWEGAGHPTYSDREEAELVD
jgi:thioredoxin 1